MINLIIDNNIYYKKQIVYTFYYLFKNINDTLKVSYKKDDSCINIYYGVEHDFDACGIFIPSKWNWNAEKQYAQLDDLYINDYNGDKYVTFADIDNVPYNKKENKIIFEYDIFYISFYLINCGEEYICEKRDDRDRFLSAFSQRKNDIAVPYFDVNVLILFDALKSMYENITMKDVQARFFLTHDVDSLNSRNIYVLMHNVKQLFCDKHKSNAEKIKNIFLDLIFNRHRQIDNYMNIELSRGAKSEFYFIAGRRHRLGKRYELKSINKQIKRLKENQSYVIGLHTNYFSYLDESAIKSEISEIEEYTGVKVLSCRNHYLRFRTPDTWGKLSAAGIRCDSTIGYSDLNGFRAATTQNYVPFNLNKNELVDLTEVPLVVMDGIVMEKELSFEEKWKEIKDIIDYNFKYKGTVSILWHQRVILDSDYKSMYEKIIDYINCNNGRFVLSTELVKEMKIEKLSINELFTELMKS